ncbi:hypothetical protein OIU76_025804 [Salix suchowensis]|nr:hypothetical protein OIU76_025804 [Salix suchowensis]
MRFVSLDGSGESNPTEKGDPANKVVKWVMPGSLYATSKEQSPPSQIGCCRWRARSQAYSLLSISIVLLLSGFSFTCFIGAGINGGILGVASLLARKVSRTCDSIPTWLPVCAAEKLEGHALIKNTHCNLLGINDFIPPLWICGFRFCLVFPELRTYIAFLFSCLCGLHKFV